MGMTSSFQATMLVMAGGAMGAAMRYHLGLALQRLSLFSLPWGTLAANIAGGFFMGLLAGWLLREGPDAQAFEGWRLLIGVGILGGFTTFSSFSLEMFTMIEQGSWMQAGGYALLSVVFALLALMLGVALMRGAIA